MRHAVALCLILFGAGSASPVFPAETKARSNLDESRIESLTGAKGKLDVREGVFRVSVPRSDLTVTTGGVRITPAMGLTSWAAFKRVGPQTMVMGDMVLLEEQVNPVMSVALDNGLEVTALHNHFTAESPRIMFLHIGGMGSEERLAAAVGKVFAAMLPVRPVEHGDIQIDSLKAFSPAKIDAILGHKGQLQDGVYKVTIGRSTRMHGHEVGSTMGVNTWAAFAQSDARAVVDGDFAVLASELQPVLKALRRHQINIVAIHQHMVDDQPRIIFLHYWGEGEAESLARALRSALDRAAAR